MAAVPPRKCACPLIHSVRSLLGSSFPAFVSHSALVFPRLSIRLFDLLRTSSVNYFLLAFTARILKQLDASLLLERQCSLLKISSSFIVNPRFSSQTRWRAVFSCCRLTLEIFVDVYFLDVLKLSPLFVDSLSEAMTIFNYFLILLTTVAFVIGA